MLIVLEGMNNVGKSTLAEWIRDTFNLPMFHHAPPDGEAEFVRTHLERWGDSDDCAVFDRFYHTYLAYPSEGNWKWGHNLPPTITEEFQVWAEAEQRRLLANRQMLLIYAQPAFEKVFKYEVDLNPAVREAEPNFRILYEAFRNLFSDWPTVHYDYTDPANVAQVHQTVTNFLLRDLV